MSNNKTKLQELEERIAALEQLPGHRLKYVVGVEPLGLVDNINCLFETPHNFKTNSLAVFVNGMLQREGVTNNYIVANNKMFTFFLPLYITDILRVNYTIDD